MGFNEDLGFATKEEVIKRNINIINRHFKIKEFSNKELSFTKNNYDLEIIGEGIKKIEFKNYRASTWSSNIVLEVNSSVKFSTAGWTEKLDCDYLLITWHGKFKECYLLLNAKMLKEWFINNKQNYPIRYNREELRFGIMDKSSYIYVPIKDLPKEMIIHHKVFTDLNDFWSSHGTKS